MEGCEGLDSEMTELLEFQCDASEAISQDDEDEVEELQNSLREVVQDPSIKPKLQCLMVDPSFSMVTVQSEDSGIVWETASSRCSTPWASDTSSVSEAYSMEGSGGAGKITIVFDEDKVVRRRTRSGGRSSRLGDRLSRPGSSRSASALGVERPEMAEVSLPNVKQEKTETEPDLEEIKNKDQQLFSLISEGYEILNIRVPSKLPTVDEEESTELQDNLSYLDQTPKIKSRNHHDWTSQQNHVLPEEAGIQDHQESSNQDSSQPSAHTEPGQTPSQKESTSDIDYFEKFTLLDEAVPGEQHPEPQEEAQQPVVKPKVEEHKPAKDTATDSPTASEESFVFVTDVEIVGEHLDEVFYGEGAPNDVLQRRGDDEEEFGARRRRESQRSGKENGSVLFGSEETVLTPIYISPGPPKIIDPILLEEPTAMSFMYSDLYEDAVGERKRSDEEQSEAESVASEKSYKRCLSDAEEEDGYLEKFILKDETPTLEVQAESEQDKDEGRMMWSQSRFEMTGCLRRVAKEENEEKTKTEEPKTQDVNAGDTSENLQSAPFEEEREILTEMEKVKGEIKLSTVPEEQAVKGASEESVQESDRTEAQEIKRKVKGDETEPPRRSADRPLPEIQEEDKKVEKTESDCEGNHCLAQKASEVLVKAPEDMMVKAPLSSEVPKMDIKSEIQTETTEKSLPEEPAPPDSKMVTPEEKVETEDKPEVRVEVNEAKTEPPGETETPAEISPCVENQAAEVVPEDAAPVEVITDQDCAVHAVVEVTEKAVNEKEIQTQVQIDLQDVNSADVTTAATEEGNKHEALASEAVAASHLPEFIAETAQDPEIKTEISSKVTEPMMPEDVKTDSDRELCEILEPLQHQQEEPVPDNEPDKTIPVTEVKAKTPTEDAPNVVQDMVNVGNELILLVPKGQAIEMDIDIGQTPSETLPEPDSTFEHLIAPEDTPASVEVEKTEPQEPEVEHLIAPEETPASVIVEKTEPQEPEVEHLIAPEDTPASVEVEKTEPQEPEVEHLIAPEDTPASVEIEKTEPQEPEVEHLIAPEDTPASVEIEKTEPQEPEVAVKLEELPSNDLDREYIPPAPVEEVIIEERKMKEDLEEDEGVFLTLRSFTPREDLSGLQREDMLSQEADAEQKMEMYKVEDVPEATVVKEDVVPDVADVHREDVGQKTERDDVVAEAPDVPGDDFDYEMISKQDAEEMPEAETLRDAVESKPESGQDREERVDREVEMGMGVEVFDLSPEEELIEDDYEIIDAEEENLARLAAELQGMDWFCITCGSLLSEDDCVSGEHHSHEVTDVDKAYEEIKEKLSDWISELQGRSENIEDLVSELELAYNSVEDQCVESEAAMQVQNEEMMALVMEQYNNMSVNMEEEKKSKLEQLYDQIVSFQESIDTAKATLETTAREEETEARSPEDIHASLKVALDSAMSLELGPKGLLVFEDYAKGNTSGSQLTQRKGIPVPQRPTLQPQEPGTATSTSVTVYWKVNPGDIIDCFQVYCMEDPQGAVSEEYRVTVKESYCVLEELEPDKTYKVWVMAVNYTGCSLPSERLAFTTAPSVPVIDTERCTVMWDAATLRWKQQTPGQSYTLEYCRQYELEGEGLRSISGISSCEQRVLLQPNENYLFYIKAVNEAGASEQSEAALISTKGTRFHLLKASAHPALELSEDRTTLHYSQDTYENTPLTEKKCPSILGELLPAQGHYYWETVVSGSTAYRLGVAYSAANRGSSLGENSLSWCLQCIPTPTGCRYQMLHNDLQSSVFVMEIPERVGTLLDYQLGRLSFYNGQSGQLLGSFSQRFTQPCHPALALEMPGSLEISMVLEVPEFTKDS